MEEDANYDDSECDRKENPEIGRKEETPAEKEAKKEKIRTFL